MIAYRNYYAYLYFVLFCDLEDVVLSHIARPELDCGGNSDLEADGALVVVEVDAVADEARPVAVVLGLDVPDDDVAVLPPALQQDPVVVGADALGAALLNGALLVTPRTPEKKRMFLIERN